MRRSTLIALAVVTVPAAVAAVLLPPSGGGSVKTEAGDSVFPDVDKWIGAATKLTVTGPTGAVVVERKAANDKAPISEGWVLADKGYPVLEATIKDILNGLVAMKKVEPKTDRPKLYARLDLDAPGKDSQSHEVELAKGDGADILKLVIGKRKYDPLGQGNDGIYIRKTDDPRTWLAKPAISVPTDALGWLDRKIVDVDADTIKEIDLTPAGGKPLVVTRDKKEDKLAIKDLPKDAKLKEAEDPAENIAEAFRYLDLDDVKPVAQLSGPVTATAHFETFNGLVGDISITAKDGSWVTVTAKGTGDGTKAADEITKRTTGWAYRIPDARATTLETKLADLLAPPEKKDDKKAEAAKGKASEKPAD